jgi:peptidoglycan/LPS O-acetylase OafA/YrhL
MFGLSETFSGICMALLIFGLWRTTNKSVLAFFTFLPFAYLGKISYALYLFHYFSMPISLILHALSGGTIPGNNAFLRFAITVAMATISWYGFELPVLRLKRFFPYGRANQAVNVSALS